MQKAYEVCKSNRFAVQVKDGPELVYSKKRASSEAATGSGQKKKMKTEKQKALRYQVSLATFGYERPLARYPCMQEARVS